MPSCCVEGSRVSEASGSKAATSASAADPLPGKVDTIAKAAESKIFRFWTCQAEGCTRPSARVVGDCGNCGKHYCAVHIFSSSHYIHSGINPFVCQQRGQFYDPCQDLRESLNEEDLLRRASALYKAEAYQIDDDYGWGDFDDWRIEINLKIRFTDDKTVMLRVVHCDVSPEGWRLESHNLRSELATLNFLRAQFNVSVPYVDQLFECEDGKYPFFGVFMPDTGGKKQTGGADLSRDDVIKSHAELLSKLYVKGGRKIGSLRLRATDGKTEIGPTAGDGMRNMPFLGPFNDAKAYYVAWCEEHLKLIADRQLCVRFPINAYLIYKYLKKMAEDGKWDDFEGKFDNGPFMPTQVDIGTWEHIHDPDWNNGICGIRGWRYARVAPAYEAFGPSMFTANMEQMEYGEFDDTREDRALSRHLAAVRPALQTLHDRPDKIRRLMFGLNCGMDIDWNKALGLFRAMNAYLPGDFRLAMEWEKTRTAWLGEHKDDERLQKLVADVKQNPGIESRSW